MRMHYHPFSLRLLLFLLCVVIFTQTGCEEANGVGELQVDPSSVTLEPNDLSVVLSVVGGITDSSLSLPLEWDVRDPRLGQIVAHSGVTAVYRRSALGGANTVIVRDQLDKEGYVTIVQLVAEDR